MIGKVGERSDFILENGPWRLQIDEKQTNTLRNSTI